MRRAFVHAATVAGVGAGPAARARLFLGTLYLRARLRLPRLPRRLIRARLALSGRSVEVSLASFSDTSLLRDVFVDGEYDMPLPPNAEVIVDLGANIGLSMVELRRRFPAATVYGFEPDPAAFALLARTTAPPSCAPSAPGGRPPDPRGLGGPRSCAQVRFRARRRCRSRRRHARRAPEAPLLELDRHARARHAPGAVLDEEGRGARREGEAAPWAA